MRVWGAHPVGDPACGRVDHTGSRVCHRLATIHLLTRDGVIQACTACAGDVRAAGLAQDEHPYGRDCDWPDSVWVRGVGSQPGRCALPGIDATAETEREEIPA